MNQLYDMIAAYENSQVLKPLFYYYEMQNKEKMLKKVYKSLNLMRTYAFYTLLASLIGSTLDSPPGKALRLK